MKKYSSPSFEIVVLGENDIITTSYTQDENTESPTVDLGYGDYEW